MKNILYMAEKRNAGIDIARVLGLTQKNEDGFFIGEFGDRRLVVAWASGHYITLKEPADIDEKYSKWTLEDLPITFDLKSCLKIIPGREKDFRVLVPYLQAADTIVNCGDAGREGELIQRWIYKMAGAGGKPTKRLWTSSLTEKGIKEANNNLREASEFDNLYAAGEARAVMDAFLGFNYSRALSLLKSDGLTITYGRCQTPLLRAIVDREREIEGFVSVPFWCVAAEIKENGFSFKAFLSGKEDGKKVDFKTKDEAERTIKNLSGKICVDDVLAERKKNNSPGLYNTLKLQKDMDKSYGFSAAKTDKILQSLYDAHKMITYPRTDSCHLTTDMGDAMNDYLSGLCFGSFDKYAKKAMHSVVPKKHFKDDTGEHHALIPVDSSDLESKYANLDQDEKKVFDAIAGRFISLFFPEEIYEVITIRLVDNENLFIAKGRKEIEPGWRIVYGASTSDDQKYEEEQELDIPEKGMSFNAEYSLKEDKTKPKRRYTESSLLTLMDINGIGTAATRSNLIDSLTKPKGKNKEVYAEKKKNTFVPTNLGKSIIGVIPEYMSSLDFLSSMDKKITAVADGELSGGLLIDQLVQELEENIMLLKVSSGEKLLSSKKPPKKESGMNCPLCGRILYEYDKGFGCSGYSENACSFFLHRKKDGKTIPASQIKKLLSEGKTDIIKGFKSRKGKSFASDLKLTDEGKVIYSFQDKK